MDKGKPGLAILIGEAMKKKKGGGDMESEGEHEYKDEDEAHQQLVEISKDLLDAIKSEDPEAVASLLHEAFECMEMSPHEEVDHEAEGEGNPY